MPAPHDDIDIVSLLTALRASLWRILAATAVMGAATYGVLSLIPPTYKSTAQIILEPASRGLLKTQNPDAANVEQKVDENEVASQVEVVRSRDLLAKVAATEHLEERAEFNSGAKPQGTLARVMAAVSGAPTGADAHERVMAMLEQAVKVTEVPKTRLINIDVFTHDPALSATVANAVAQAFLERNRASQVKDAKDTTTYIDSNINEVKAGAEAAETALERFRAESGLLSGSNNVTLNSQQLSELNTQLSQATAARTEAEARARIVREMVNGGRVDGSADIIRSPNMQQLFQQKLRVERDLAELSATLLPAHPRMRQLNAELQVSKTRLSEEARRVVVGMQGDVEVALARETALQASIARLTDAKLRSSDAQAKLSSLEREAQSKRTSYDRLLQRLNEVSNQRDRSAVSALASLNESAVPSRVVDSPRKSQLTLLAAAATLLLGMFYVLSRELMRGAPGGRGRGPAARTQGDRRAGTVAPAPVLSVVPAVPMARLTDTATLAADIARLPVGPASGRILVTGETDDQDLWKAASALAQRLATTATPVVFVDLVSAGDGGGPGLFDLVHGRASFEDVVRPAETGNCHRIAAGARAAALRLDGAKVEPVFAALDAIYTHVLVAAPRSQAKAMLEALEGNFGVGVVVADVSRPSASPLEDGFLGYDVSGLSVFWLDAAQAPARQKLSRPMTPARLGAASA
jgi:polysaccharide biosynthesis transport protein